MSINRTILVGNLGRDPAPHTQKSTVVPVAHDSKVRSTLAAQFALAGRELRVITKGGRSYFEVRRWNECYACSTLHDLRGLLAQIGGTT